MKIMAAVIGALAAPAAFAQSNVTLYGLLDAGVSYVTNQGGHSVVKFDDGISVPSFIGLRGAEDLGGGTQAIFDLESQFMLANGEFIPGQGIFGRNAYVGLKDERFGTVTLGNQFDFMNDSLTMSGNVPGVVAGGLYNYPAGPFRNLGIPNNATGWSDWDRTAQEQVHNSVKYLSPDVAGFKVGALYSFGGVAGDFRANSAVSFGLNYATGKFGAGAAYTEVRYLVGTQITAIRNWGLGAHYDFGPLRAIADFTTVRNEQNGAYAWQTSAGGLYSFSPAWSIGLAYTYMKGNDVLENAHASQFGGTLNYTLSKRTLVYLAGIFQIANEGQNALANGLFDPTMVSSSNKQGIVRIGMRTSF